MKKISVCVPAYNEEERIQACLESALRQQGVEISEILVGINSSTDHTRQIVEASAKTDPRIRVVDSPKGKVNAWNALNAVAKNDLRIFQDGDCAASAGAYARLVDELGDNEIIGASSERNYEGRKITSMILNFPRRYISVIPILNGGLYLMDYQKVSSCFKNKLGVVAMPAGMINEDNFLQGICPRVAVSESAFVLINPSGGILEEIERYKRMFYGHLIAARKYPAVFTADFEKISFYLKAVNLLKIFRLATLSEKIVFPFVIPVRSLIYAYIHLMARRAKTTSDFSWK
jgi:glycosyltransferase involved in cell wall biosynthesis